MPLAIWAPVATNVTRHVGESSLRLGVRDAGAIGVAERNLDWHGLADLPLGVRRR